SSASQRAVRSNGNLAIRRDEQTCDEAVRAVVHVDGRVGVPVGSGEGVDLELAGGRSRAAVVQGELIAEDDLAACKDAHGAGGREVERRVGTRQVEVADVVVARLEGQLLPIP